MRLAVVLLSCSLLLPPAAASYDSAMSDMALQIGDMAAASDDAAMSDMALQMGDMAAAMSAPDRQEMMSSAGQRSGACHVAGGHQLDTPGTCTYNNYIHWKSHIEQCSCKPRESVVSLQDAATFNMIRPSVVVMNRCSGWCSHMVQTCMPLETAEKAVTVLHSGPSAGRQCGTVRVQDHVRCGCGCPLTATDCNDQQVFRLDLCMCQCKKSADWRSCGSRRRWDSSRCRCVCQQHSECSTGFGWSSQYCSCLRMMMPPVGEEPQRTGAGSAGADDENSIYT